MTDDIPPGWSHNPSAWPRRLPGLILALTGLGIATYLGLYQLHVVATVWEPFFGAGSRYILRESSIARLLPVPDALLGAFLYFLEFLAENFGGADRWRTRPWVVVLLGILAALMGIGGVLLAVAQPVLFGAFCTLCLASAACSILLFFAVLDEVRATLHHLRGQRAGGGVDPRRPAART
jgi:uncharacterized membrane protein